MAPRMLTSLPFAPGPAALSMHPRLAGTVVVASASGAFVLADAAGGMAPMGMYQARCSGGGLRCLGCLG